MARFLTLLVLALLTVAEVAAVTALAERFGTFGALVVLGLDVLVGLWVLAWGVRSEPPKRGWRMAAGAVIAIPGLVLDLVGFALLVPPVQRWLGMHVTRSAQTVMSRQGVTVVTVTDEQGRARTTVVPGDVIAGEVIETDDGPAAQPGPNMPTDRPGGSPGSGPSVIRGELTDG